MRLRTTGELIWERKYKPKKKVRCNSIIPPVMETYLFAFLCFGNNHLQSLTNNLFSEQEIFSPKFTVPNQSCCIKMATVLVPGNIASETTTLLMIISDPQALPWNIMSYQAWHTWTHHMRPGNMIGFQSCPMIRVKQKFMGRVMV